MNFLRETSLRFKRIPSGYKIIMIRQFNPISAGVLENQDTLGGGQFDPPPLNPMFDVQI